MLALGKHAAPRSRHLSVLNTDFDLEAVRAKLDEQGMTIAANQEASIKSRRKLADVTKSALLRWRVQGYLCLAPVLGAAATMTHCMHNA